MRRTRVPIENAQASAFHPRMTAKGKMDHGTRPYTKTASPTAEKKRKRIAA